MALHFFRPWSLRKKPGPSPQLPEKNGKTCASLASQRTMFDWGSYFHLFPYICAYICYIYTYYIFNIYIYIYIIYICPIISPLCHHYGWWVRIIGKDHFLCLIVSSPGSLSKMAKLLARQIRSTKKLGHSCIPQLFQSWLCQFSHIYPSMARDVEQIIKKNHPWSKVLWSTFTAP